MFENLTKRFSDIWGRVRTRKLSEKNIKDTLREIRVALLEADVALPVVKTFLKSVEEKALGDEVSSLSIRSTMSLPPSWGRLSRVSSSSSR